MAQSDAEGNWISLMDYAQVNNVSLSTLRRRIKGKRVQFKIKKGRYLLWHDGEVTRKTTSGPSNALESKLKGVEKDLQKAQEEIAELKTLIALYEEQLPKKTNN